MKKIFVLVLLISFCTSSLLIAQKAITVEDIWQKYTFFPKSVPGFNFQKDGQHYTRLEGNMIKQYDLTSGKITGVIFDGSNQQVIEYQTNVEGKIEEQKVPLQIDSYQFTSDESKIILFTGTESIYRRSSKSHAYILDAKSKVLTNVAPKGKQMYTSLSPNNDRVAYVRDNNLYHLTLVNQKEHAITTDGTWNKIINGSADWVYEEEFSMSKSFKWSPDGKKIAFLRFDESAVEEFTMQLYYNGAYPKNETFKYPKVGEENADVTAHIYDLKSAKTTKVQTGKAEYFPRLFWLNNSEKLVVFKMNRHQNELELLLADASSGKITTLLKETNKYYVDIHDNLTFLDDGKHFIWTSEQDGWNHIYLYDMDGKMVRQLTKGNFDVTEFYGYDEKNKTVFYQAAKESPMERQIYSVDIKGLKTEKITPLAGTNNAQFSSTFDYYVVTHSTANSPATYTVYNRKGKKTRVIEDNRGLRELQKTYGTTAVEFFQFSTSDNVDLNGYMIKPPLFDATKKYPVFMYVYGGPGSQTVNNAFGGYNYWWFQMLAQKGYIVVSVDNRGTGARGEEFRKMTYLQLGKYETIDQIEAAKYLGNLPYVDAKRIGIFGWSYGGYMSSLALFKGADIFKSAIAVAPVTNWKWYDTIYTERYMRTIKENEEGYEDNSPVNFADRLQGNYLLVHGIADDNVHVQNSFEMVDALVRAGKQFESYFYPNRNHGIFGGNTRHHLYTKMTDFILDNL
jgi:dipeptidyl-peptidase-4